MKFDQDLDVAFHPRNEVPTTDPRSVVELGDCAYRQAEASAENVVNPLTHPEEVNAQALAEHAALQGLNLDHLVLGGLNGATSSTQRI